MVHAAGVGYLDRPLSSAEAQNPERFARILAAQSHNDGGIRKRHYHGVTGGWYINEILKRTNHPSVGQIAREHYRKVYGIEWYLNPYQEEYDGRIAKLYLSRGLRTIFRLVDTINAVPFLRRLNQGNIFHKTFTVSMPDQAGMKDYTSLSLRRFESPSFSGYTNARSVSLPIFIYVKSKEQGN